MVGSYNPVTSSVSGNYGLGGSYTPVSSTGYVPGSLSGASQYGPSQYYNSVLGDHFSGEKLANYQQQQSAMTGLPLGGAAIGGTSGHVNKVLKPDAYAEEYEAAYAQLMENKALRAEELRQIENGDIRKAQKQANLMNQSSGYPAGSSVSSGGGGGFNWGQGLQMGMQFVKLAIAI